MPLFFRWTLVSKAIGVLLLAAAGLKVLGLGEDPLGGLGVFSTAEFRVFLIEFEVFLGLWLVFRAPLGSWILALLTFMAFAVVTFYLGWIGRASCGCFGRLSENISPWLAFAVDVAVLAALLLGRPDLQPLWQNPRRLFTFSRPVACVVVGAFMLLAFQIWLTYLLFGSTDAALAYLRGETLSLRPRLLDVGRGNVGEELLGTVQLTNRTAAPIRLIGGTSDCSCVATEDLPITIPAGEGRSISVKIRLPAAAGIFRRTAILLTDDARARRINFQLTGRIIKPASNSTLAERK